ncbi:ABC transporter permease [Paraburkholderia sp. BR13439]|uniref:ABC transporter permease n=1 Tax=unclassified Paraburkholderia TaxID=2615204 RepID=UPI0034CD2F07
MNFLDLLNQYGPDFGRSLGTTLELVGISVLAGAVLALPIAAGRLSPNRFVRKSFFCYTYLFRGTPLLAQVFLLYYGAGKFRHELQAFHVWWIFRDSFWCAVLAFAANTSAYQAEIWRGALQAVPWGQWEAAHALGVSRSVAFVRVILPQATLIALRPLGNELILMLKASSIASVISVHELMGATGIAFARTFDFQFYCGQQCSIWCWSRVFAGCGQSSSADLAGTSSSQSDGQRRVNRSRRSKLSRA